MKLGKKPPKIDPRTLVLSSYIGAALRSPPVTCSWTKPVKSWDMLKNDTIGDCTIAAAGHLIQGWTAANRRPAGITDGDAIRAYSAISGYDPRTGDNDDGAYMIDALNYWRRTGVGTHKIGAFTALDRGNKTHAKLAVWLFGGAYAGFDLPVSAQSQTVWDVPASGLRGRGAPGSWGGHAVSCVGMDSVGLVCVTWGKLKRMTWKFFQNYCDEAYTILSNDWISGTGKAPSGFNLLSLQKDLAAL